MKKRKEKRREEKRREEKGRKKALLDKVELILRLGVVNAFTALCR
jgi:hypothetical protein